MQVQGWATSGRYRAGRRHLRRKQRMKQSHLLAPPSAEGTPSGAWEVCSLQVLKEASVWSTLTSELTEQRPQ